MLQKFAESLQNALQQNWHGIFSLFALCGCHQIIFVCFCIIVILLQHLFYFIMYDINGPRKAKKMAITWHE